MLVPENWLKQWIETNLSIEKIAEVLTMSGLEVESLTSLCPDFSNVVVGKVLNCSKHPNAEKLKICNVDVGNELSIVCGAPNVRDGLLVACALVGANLPNNKKIKKSKIRGYESLGMLCSEFELGISNSSSEIIEIDPKYKNSIGADYRSLMGFEEMILNIKPTPNRGDCLSVMGIARDLSAVSEKVKFKTPDRLNYSKHNVLDSFEIDFKIDISSEQICRRFCSRVIKGVDSTLPTPNWIKKELEKIGQKPISVLVDISNYVMFCLGRPSHIFDFDKLNLEKSKTLEVRWSKPNEKIILLNSDEIECKEKFAVISDNSGAVALAGIMGGMRTMVTNDTSTILVESAFWLPNAIRGKSQKLRLTSDASYRFERGVDPESVENDLNLICSLIVDICGGSTSNLIDAKLLQVKKDQIPFDKEKCDRILGFEVSLEKMKKIFLNLGMEINDSFSNGFLITPPVYRFDINIEEDLIEEIARIVGFDSIPEKYPLGFLKPVSIKESIKSFNDIRESLIYQDFYEVITYGFIEKESAEKFKATINNTGNSIVSVLNPISTNMDTMRTSLLPGLIKVLSDNVKNQQERVRIFEIGKVFHKVDENYSSNGIDGLMQTDLLSCLIYGNNYPEQWGEKNHISDFYDLKGIFSNLINEKFDFKSLPSSINFLHPGKSASIHNSRFKKQEKNKNNNNPKKINLFGNNCIGFIGELHPELSKKYQLHHSPVVIEVELSFLTDVKIPSWSDYSKAPFVRRDVAFLLNHDLEVGDVVKEVRKNISDRKNGNLVSDFYPFDLYTGNDLPLGKKSITFRVLMQDFGKTLNESQVDSVLQSIILIMQKVFDAELRN